MSSKLVPSNPSEVMVIRRVTPNIVTCSAPFSRFGRFKVGGRGTIVRLQSGSLAVFSAIALTPEVRETVSSLGGQVRYLIAPDFEHHIFLTQWASAYPSAKLLGPEGLPEKREKSKETAGTHFQHVITKSNKNDFKVGPEFDADFDCEYVHSHANKEIVFNYRPDRTLIEADLLFNLPAHEQYSRSGTTATAGILTRMFVGLMSAAGPAIWQKRFNWYVASAMDRSGFNKSIHKIDKFDFDRIIPCHGDVIESGGKGIFRKVFDWHLNAKK
ncbi:MAG: hypothetical protein M1830_007984 [Pleopsidium flavum]|nr:MAG: hypothetical protein M1830_007984 [Pleopsidium flavum]